MGDIRKTIYNIVMNIKGIIYLPLVIVSLLFSGCEFIRKYQLGDAVVRAGDEVLYAVDLERVTQGYSGEDSAAIAEQYIRQWATEALVYQSAVRHSDNKAEIESLVNEYRRSLYMYEWEQQQVEQRMSKHIDKDSITIFYNTNSDRFTLREALLKGLFMVVPNDAPEQNLLMLWLKDLSDENIELIEKYSYQYATGYEFFADEWQPQSKILIRMPLTQDDFSKQLQSKELIEIKDSINTYLLKISDKRLAGEIMPEEYAAKTIEHILLEKRQKEFLTKQKNDLYLNALRRNKVIRSENKE